MSNYHVTFNRDIKKWKVLKAGSDRVSGYYDTQAEAEANAKQFSSNQGGGEVRIHRRDNSQIRDSDTVKPGNDPRNIKDTKH